MESKINGRSGGEKHRDSLRAGETLTLSTEGVLSMTGLFMTTVGAATCKQSSAASLLDSL